MENLGSIHHEVSDCYSLCPHEHEHPVGYRLYPADSAVAYCRAMGSGGGYRHNQPVAIPIPHMGCRQPGSEAR